MWTEEISAVYCNLVCLCYSTRTWTLLTQTYQMTLWVWEPVGPRQAAVLMCQKGPIRGELRQTSMMMMMMMMEASSSGVMTTEDEETKSDLPGRTTVRLSGGGGTR